MDSRERFLTAMTGSPPNRGLHTEHARPSMHVAQKLLGASRGAV